MNAGDVRLMRVAIEASRRAKAKGNHPFGAVLADEQSNVLLEAENTVVTDRDCTAHAEASLIRQASRQYDRDFLANCTVCTSTEPCAMCAAAIFWSNVRRIVYGLSKPALNAMVPEDEEDVLTMRCAELFDTGRNLHALLDNYFDESERYWQIWGEDLTDSHRSLSTYLNGFLDAGFVIARVVEPSVAESDLKQYPELEDELRVPNLIIYVLDKPVRQAD
jgi:tRNA(Arg) A34 adenosine deaminase TadA